MLYHKMIRVSIRIMYSSYKWGQSRSKTLFQKERTAIGLDSTR